MNKEHLNCRICGGSDLTSYFNAGLLPLANNNESTRERSLELERHPLNLMFCNTCGLSQLSLVADPVEMFSNYDYRSAINKGYVKHCNYMAYTLKEKYNLKGDEFIIDIAGNDGTLLNEFRKVLGDKLKVLNIDPAENLTAIAELNEIQSITDFWSLEFATNKLKLFTVLKADIITSTNVFAHVDDVNDFVKAVKLTLKETGVWVVEFPYLVDFIEKYEFDTVYHEHLSYFSLIPLIRLVESNDMKVIDVEKSDIHGGSLRVHIAHSSNPRQERNVSFFVDKELRGGFNKIEKYSDWSNNINQYVANFVQKINIIKQDGKKIAAFAASAKGNTLLNYSKLNHKEIDYIVDETPEKIGKYYAGTGIQIVNKSNLLSNPPDYLIILSWNFSKDIIEKCIGLGFKGKFIIPIPDFKVIG